jgi:hypothetical protein
MRTVSIWCFMASASCLGVNQLGAQTTRDPNGLARYAFLPPLISDSTNARMRALGILPAARTAIAGAAQNAIPLLSRIMTPRPAPLRHTCPMPVARPDSSTRYASVEVALPPSGARMPTSVPACTNPLDGQR